MDSLVTIVIDNKELRAQIGSRTSRQRTTERELGTITTNARGVSKYLDNILI